MPPQLFAVGKRVIYLQGISRGVPYGPPGSILRRRREAPRYLVHFDAEHPFPGTEGREHWIDHGDLASEPLK